MEQEFCVGFFALDQGGPEESTSKVQVEKSINDEVRKMMSVLFASLEPELVSFLATYEKVDSLYVVSILFTIFRKTFTNHLTILNN